MEARLPYVTDGDGMHTFTDPADGERYVSAYVGIDITQRVFACFDQVDLKAPITLRVVADPAWTVLSNSSGRHARRRTRGSSRRRRRSRSTCSCCAPGRGTRGPSSTRGLPMGWHARRSLAAELDRDFDELRRITEQCFDHYAELFDEPFPFDTYDQVFVPELNWGAMENPGCVTFRDEFLPRGRVTEVERRLRAMVIAHEMSHMWFGDLVTQTWWEDIWLNESFAEYMGFRVSEDAAGFAGTWVGFEVTHKPRAMVADRRRSTHPVAPLPEDVPDVDTASTNFDAISYVKGASALRQLVTWMGDEDFLAGVNAHLTQHRFGNATLADLVGALDEASPRDVRAWAEVWLRQSGHDTIRVERDGDVPVLVRDGVRPHRFLVTAYDDGLAEVDRRVVDLDADAGAAAGLGRPGRRAQLARRDVRPGAARRALLVRGRGRPRRARGRPGARRCCGRRRWTPWRAATSPPSATSPWSTGTCRPSGTSAWSPRSPTRRSGRSCRRGCPPPTRSRCTSAWPPPAGPGSTPAVTRWRSPAAWPAPAGTPTSCAAGWPTTAPTTTWPSTRSCGGGWCSGSPVSARSTPTRSRRSAAATARRTATSAPPPRSPPGPPPRPRPRRGRR